MNWLNDIVDEVIKRRADGDILIESGGSPSGTYHLGHIRELVICDAILLELQRRGRTAKHVYFADDLDGLRKIPVNVPASHEQYLGKPLCDIPAPDGSKNSYGDFFLQGLIDACQALNIDVEFIRSHTKYRTGFFVTAIEKSLEHIEDIRRILETISGHKLGEEWSPVQVNEDGYLKKRKFLRIDKSAQTITYEDKDGSEQTINYAKGDVKLDWRIDWPARWWLLHVDVEPAGRDHSSSGGSFETGLAILKDVFNTPPILPVQYDFINLTGDTKKMSASKGTGLDAVEGATLMPPEVLRYFILRSPPSKRLYFDPVNGVVQLMDEFAALAAKTDKDKAEQQLFDICMWGQDQPTVSSVPFSHLVASYQASLRDADKTLEIIRRTEYKDLAEGQGDVIRRELKFIDAWLDKRAPEDVKFELLKQIDASEFTDTQKQFLAQLADKLKAAPQDADGEWFHELIYDLKDSTGLEPKELFQTLYQALIGKNSGPRAGWFLSLLPRDWLLKRLRLES
ncbi:MAG TPA: lysine--tRNA ligase [Patescibacteria group bacterium]|nr:lysine--tRNA ligase [Patescibacteria group bacterium]